MTPSGYSCPLAASGLEAERKRTDKSFFVPKSEIAGNDYDLSINRYKEVEYEAVEYDPPQVILCELKSVEAGDRAGEWMSWRALLDELSRCPYSMSVRAHRAAMAKPSRQV